MAQDPEGAAVAGADAAAGGAMRRARKANPLANRIKRLMQTDEDVGKIAQASPALIGTAQRCNAIRRVLRGHARGSIDSLGLKFSTTAHLPSVCRQGPGAVPGASLRWRAQRGAAVLHQHHRSGPPVRTSCPRFG